MSGSQRRVVVHMDCDAFYYSVECIRDPSLVGRPVVVSGSGPRAVVTTASYEARKYGVGSSMPTSKALRLCPGLTVVPIHGDLYRAKSEEVWSSVREHLGRDLQHVSLDEAYADITDLVKPVSIMREVVEQVQSEAGITLSVGIGPSRSVAKAASDCHKPSGFVILSREQACEMFADHSTRVLQGVGPKTNERLASIGVETVRELQELAEEDLAMHFGSRMGRSLKARAVFLDDSPVVTERVAKSRSSETTFDVDVSDPEALEETVRRLAKDVSEVLQRRGVRGRTIGIKVRLDNWTTVTRDRSIDRFAHDTETITRIALELLREYSPPRAVRLLGVRVASFEGVADAVPAHRTSAAIPPASDQQLVLPL